MVVIDGWQDVGKEGKSRSDLNYGSDRKLAGCRVGNLEGIQGC